MNTRSSWLPSLDVMTVVMIGILVCGCFPAVIAYKVLIKRYKEEHENKRPPNSLSELAWFEEEEEELWVL